MAKMKAKAKAMKSKKSSKVPAKAQSKKSVKAAMAQSKKKAAPPKAAVQKEDVAAKPQKVAAKVQKASAQAQKGAAKAPQAAKAQSAAMKTAIATAQQPSAKPAAKIEKAPTTEAFAVKPVKTSSAKTVGQAAPDFELRATGGQTVNLRQMNGKKVVLYFYPKDMTPGCTIQGHEFTKLKNEFEAQNAVVLGVSRDTVELHEKFKAKECYTIDLLSDSDEKLCKTFDVIKDKNMYGKMVKGIERSTFVIDENGQVVHEWRGVKAEGHAGEVLNYLKSQLV